MNSQRTSFLQALRLPPDLTDEACSRSISDFISLVASQQSHSISLKYIHEAITRYDCAVYLEPLDVLPTLLPCRYDGATDLIRICALNNSPKEIMIVVQEAIETLQSRLDEDEANVPDLVQRTIGIVLLCSPAIDRSRLGKRSALEICSPILESITSLISSASSLCTKEDGRVLITEVARLVKSLSVWASVVADANELQKIKSLLRELLDTTVLACAPSIQALLAVRAAKRHFPRFFAKPFAQEEWQNGEAAMREVQLALESLGQFPPTTCSSFSDLTYLAHSTPPATLSPSPSSDLHHLLVNALHMNMVIDEALFLLFRVLTHENMSISPEILASFCTAFTALASTHLDPTIRHLNLRLLSLTLTKLPPATRVDMLLNLTTNEDFPQIRGPAVGLVKEAVLEALALPANSASGDPFASPELLRIFGIVLFRPNPPEFFSEKKTREELAQSLELLRIADCLSFYYVLLQRDSDNRTGVRSTGNVTSVQSFLRPLRAFVDEHIGGEDHPLMAILSLQVGLDRIDGALRMLGLGEL